jgi:hypothetical protein
MLLLVLVSAVLAAPDAPEVRLTSGGRIEVKTQSQMIREQATEIECLKARLLASERWQRAAEDKILLMEQLVVGLIRTAEMKAKEKRK